jgi:hypothetical protein
MKPSAFTLTPLAVLALIGAGAPAEAAIKCQNGAQLVSGSYIITPYCQDKLLAQVARQYGSRVSFAEIRDNPNSKRHVCRLVGRDIRVYENCQTVNPSGRRGF